MGEERIKIGTLTFHMAHNYGAMLQAYALPIAVRKLGWECEVIDYRFPYIDRWSRVRRWADLRAEHGVMGSMLRLLKRCLTGEYNPHTMRMKFDYFERKIMPHSQKVYRDVKELDNLPYQVILFGSDQIWNPFLTNGIAYEYIGGFKCLPGTKKIAYAASCGSTDFKEEVRDVYDRYVKDFSAVGVREMGFRDSLTARGIRAECVLDPTLLLTEQEWRGLFCDRKKPDSPYLLLYVFDEDDSIYDIAREMAKKNNLEIVAIAYKKKPAMYGMEVKTDCGPLEFLNLFSGAERIITTSFHGTAFSILFHKHFYCVPHPKYHERTDSLLQLLKLEEHNMTEAGRWTDRFCTDWNAVDAVLEEERRKALDFLSNAILL